jgi:hypothetical protein
MILTGSRDYLFFLSLHLAYTIKYYMQVYKQTNMWYNAISRRHLSMIPRLG